MGVLREKVLLAFSSGSDTHRRTPTSVLTQGYMLETKHRKALDFLQSDDPSPPLCGCRVPVPMQYAPRQHTSP